MYKAPIREITRSCQFRPITKWHNLYWHSLSGIDARPQCKSNADCPICSNVGGMQIHYLVGAIDRADNQYVIYRLDSQMYAKVNAAKRGQGVELTRDNYDIVIDRVGGKLMPGIINIRPLSLDEQALRGQFMNAHEIKAAVDESPRSCLNSIYKRYMRSLETPKKLKPLPWEITAPTLTYPTITIPRLRY